MHTEADKDPAHADVPEQSGPAEGSQFNSNSTLSTKYLVRRKVAPIGDDIPGRRTK